MSIRKGTKKTKETEASVRKKRATYSVDEIEISKNIGDLEGKKTQYNFAIRLNDLLEKKEIDQVQLSENTGIMMSSISGYRRGKVEPGITVATKLVSALGVSLDYLVGLVDDETPETNKRATCEYLGLSQKAIDSIVKIKEDRRFSLDNLILNYLFNAGYISELINVIKYDLKYFIYDESNEINTNVDWAFLKAIQDENEQKKFRFASIFIEGIYKNRIALSNKINSQMKGVINAEMNQLKREKIKKELNNIVGQTLRNKKQRED